MNHTGISAFKILFIFCLFLGFSFVLIEQRLESKNYDMQIKRIESVIDQIKSEKRNVALEINSEMNRLNHFDTTAYGKPISMNDIVFIPVSPVQETKKIDSSPQKSIFDSKLDCFIQNTVVSVLSGFRSN